MLRSMIWPLLMLPAVFCSDSFNFPTSLDSSATTIVESVRTCPDRLVIGSTPVLCCMSTGLCQASSCTTINFPNSQEANCNGPNSCCNVATCNYSVPTCQPANGQHCYGTVVCDDGSNNCCPGAGQLCLEDGHKWNYKVCTNGVPSPARSRSPLPSVPVSPRPCTATPPKSVQIWAGQNYYAGTLTVTWTSSRLIFDYALFAGWKTTTLHIYVGTSPPSTCAPGQFPVILENFAGTQHYTVETELSRFGVQCTPYTRFYFAVHGQVSGISSETAWAWNKVSQTGYNSLDSENCDIGWSHYFSEDLDCSCVPPVASARVSPPPLTSPPASASQSASAQASPSPRPSIPASPGRSPSAATSSSRSPSARTISPTRPSNSASPRPCTYPPPKTIQIWAAQFTNAGTLTMTWTGFELIFDYALNDGWTTDLLHIYVGIAPPNTSAPGQFPVILDGFAPTQRYTVSTELAQFRLQCSQSISLIVAVHAEVDGPSHETAWAWNKDQFGNDLPDCGRGNIGWSHYFSYDLDCSCVSPPASASLTPSPPASALASASRSRSPSPRPSPLPSASTSASPSGVPSASTSASPSGVPSPSPSDDGTHIKEISAPPSASPQCVCTGESAECVESVDNYLGNGYDNRVVFPELLDASSAVDSINEYGSKHGGSYNCRIDSDNCHLIVCDSFVPKEAYDGIMTCPSA